MIGTWRPSTKTAPAAGETIDTNGFVSSATILIERESSAVRPVTSVATARTLTDVPAANPVESNVNTYGA